MYMPNVPNFRDLQRLQRVATDRFNFKNVIGSVHVNSMGPAPAPTPPVLTVYPGLFGTWYAGDFAGDPAWFATATPMASGYKQRTCSETNNGSDTSWQWTGYFNPPVDGNFKFEGLGDDYLLMWFGDAAKDANFTLANVALSSYANAQIFTADLNDLKADTYYPVRLQWGHPAVITYNGMYLALLSAQGDEGSSCSVPNIWFRDQIADNAFWGNNVPAGVENIGALQAAWVPADLTPAVIYSSPNDYQTDMTIQLPADSTITHVITAILTYAQDDGLWWVMAMWEPDDDVQPAYDGGAGSMCRITWNNRILFEQVDGEVTVYNRYAYTSPNDTLHPALYPRQNGIMQVVIETVNSGLSAGLRFQND